MTEARQTAEPALHLSERLKAARSERGISQAQAARELDVARSAYRLWEMQVALPSLHRWGSVARWLGVTVATLLVAEGLIERDDPIAFDNAS
jgi:transcriptional regulator with XRE-family HTH domain